jgi:hypothetical protein
MISPTVETNKVIGKSDAATNHRLANLLAPLDQVGDSVNIIANHSVLLEVGGRIHELPRYIFVGPKAGDAPIRIGIFAGIHGDEPEGSHALIRFLQTLDAKPELAEGYCLFVYPVCNPTGIEDGTRHSRGGKDLNREFWRDSSEPEVKLLEQELASHAFHGIISLHTDDTSHGFYGFASGATLTEYLIEPALRAAERFLPRNGNAIIDGFAARDGIIREGYEGVLSAPPEARLRPFEIILETPKTPPAHLKEEAFVEALLIVLAEYRQFIAYAPNL